MNYENISLVGYIVLTCILCVGLIYAFYTDIKTLKIKNSVVLLVLACSFLRMGLSAPYGFVGSEDGFLNDLLINILVSLFIFFIFFIFWMMKGMGAGDVKLIGALSLWFDAKLSIYFVMAFGLIGGIVALCIIGLRVMPHWKEKFSNTFPQILQEGKINFPYGPMIVIGAFFTLYLQFQQLGLI